MDANQLSSSNPFGMDEDCTNCPDLCEARTEIAHGYGDVGAEFLFVGERPSPGADETGIPFFGDERGEAFQEILHALGFAGQDPGEKPELDNVYLTLLTRCRHPERPPTEAEIGNCEPYLNAEIRMINPEIIVPVGQRALEEIATEYTTTPAEEFDIEADHATEIRGRGFELVPMIDPAEVTDEQREDFLQAFSDLFGRDYRQTKGRRGR
ncbi:uracil-DNA glycosylase [Halalkalicoccus jeotgali]|uniref:Uracil-DNA glycosylase n=1 Tax=Halalkalicoccus jeotgali (strain DSM 18796 / CECT 7217 / JCM 14584 / KCTC 4019 / B3) TaxID=795797 RepID=D8J337_HALJB|nr:uracil-DNA glycosylase [Halalkalicoccus jeotgali]ADJ15144.1 uracil-DNA glycosylase superfamily [Halalkalicoccus jeotgali B3]ELY35136.1 uracil-DNA glycosylase [Halalkalicoccus jeotgali B3]